VLQALGKAVDSGSERASIKWITDGDICSRFFHAHATVKHRRNTIASLTDDNGTSFSEHDQKANFLWNAGISFLRISMIYVSSFIKKMFVSEV
jgi:hypothetical protein